MSETIRSAITANTAPIHWARPITSTPARPDHDTAAAKCDSATATAASVDTLHAACHDVHMEAAHAAAMHVLAMPGATASAEPSMLLTGGARGRVPLPISACSRVWLSDLTAEHSTQALPELPEAARSSSAAPQHASAPPAAAQLAMVPVPAANGACSQHVALLAAPRAAGDPAIPSTTAARGNPRLARMAVYDWAASTQAWRLCSASTSRSGRAMPAPWPRAGFACAAVRKRAVMFGGVWLEHKDGPEEHAIASDAHARHASQLGALTADSALRRYLLQDVWTWNVEKRRWKLQTPSGVPPSHRAYAVACAIGGDAVDAPSHQIALYGGIDCRGRLLNDVHVLSFNASVAVPAADSVVWSRPQLDAMPPFLAGGSAVAWQGSMLVFGGWAVPAPGTSKHVLPPCSTAVRSRVRSLMAARTDVTPKKAGPSAALLWFQLSAPGAVRVRSLQWQGDSPAGCVGHAAVLYPLGSHAAEQFMGAAGSPGAPGLAPVLRRVLTEDAVGYVDASGTQAASAGHQALPSREALVFIVGGAACAAPAAWSSAGVKRSRTSPAYPGHTPLFPELFDEPVLLQTPTTCSIRALHVWATPRLSSPSRQALALARTTTHSTVPFIAGIAADDDVPQPNAASQSQPQPHPHAQLLANHPSTLRADTTLPSAPRSQPSQPQPSSRALAPPLPGPSQASTVPGSAAQATSSASRGSGQQLAYLPSRAATIQAIGPPTQPDHSAGPAGGSGRQLAGPSSSQVGSKPELGGIFAMCQDIARAVAKLQAGDLSQPAGGSGAGSSVTQLHQPLALSTTTPQAERHPGLQQIWQALTGHIKDMAHATSVQQQLLVNMQHELSAQRSQDLQAAHSAAAVATATKRVEVMQHEMNIITMRMGNLRGQLEARCGELEAARQAASAAASARDAAEASARTARQQVAALKTQLTALQGQHRQELQTAHAARDAAQQDAQQAKAQLLQLRAVLHSTDKLAARDRTEYA